MTKEELLKELEERWKEVESGQIVDNEAVIEYLKTWNTNLENK